MSWSKVIDNTQYLKIFEHVRPRGKCSLGRNVHARDGNEFRNHIRSLEQ